MGANQSTSGGPKNSNSNLKSKSKPQTTVSVMHKAVSWYLFNSKLSKLDDPTYCEDLIILTSDVLDKVLTLKEVTYLDQHIKGENVIDKKKTERLMYGWNSGSDTRKNINKRVQDFKVYDSVKKKRMCKGIAKFYVKFGHLFNAIHKSINPQWVYYDEDEKGKKIRIQVSDSSKIPSNKRHNRKLVRDSLCSNRIHALYADMVKDTIDGKEVDMAKIKMDICDMNKPKNKQKNKVKSKVDLNLIKKRMVEGSRERSSDRYDIRGRSRERSSDRYDIRGRSRERSSDRYDKREKSVDRYNQPRQEIKSDKGTSISSSSSDKVLYARPYRRQQSAGAKIVANDEKSLFNEIGIPELEKLYYDEYNIDNHKYSGMTIESKKKYKEDLEIFYKAFTGQEKIPEGINKFSHIRLKSYHKDAICSNPDLSWQRKSIIKFDKSKASSEFDIYAKHLATMSNNTFKYENQLLSILNKLFSKDSAPSYTEYGHKSKKKNNVIINPNLDEKNLQTIIDETRKILVEMYVNCHKDFLEGKQKFEAVLNRIGINTQLARLKELTNEQKKMQIELRKNYT
ncbi:MAG: hypothetical protein CML42_09575 [Rhodobacteraceae bacterium]|nr:hypothetical protein [Paracoccaceae bacterium]